MEGKFFDRTLVTKRITVDYETQKVTFEEPKDEDEIVKHPIWTVFQTIVADYMFLGVIGIFVLFFILILEAMLNGHFLVGICTTIFELSLFILWIIFFTPPLIITGIIVKKYQDPLTILPELYYLMNHHIFRRKEYKVIVKKLPRPTFEIPVFYNVMVRYDARGEFSKFLKKVEIKDYPFTITEKQESRLRRILNRLHHKKDIEKEEPYPHLWRVLFTFSQIPKKGKLTVWFL